MPVKIPSKLPARKLLEQENIFVMTEKRALSQEIRPLQIAILNLMPTKEVTETQLLRLLGNSPLQLEVVLLRTASYVGTNTPQEHLSAFYRTFEEVKEQKFDGLIITGAPVERLDFRAVKYWDEMEMIMKWAITNVYSTLYICWAAQAGLYYHFGLQKHDLDKKLSGIYKHRVHHRNNPLVRGFDEFFLAPHSRHTDISREDILKNKNLVLLAESDEAGVYLAASRDGKNVFITGHGEYDADTLEREYLRDKAAGLDIELPFNYYPDNDPTKRPHNVWRAHANLLFANWINNVYQETPYNIEEIGKHTFN